MSEARLARRRQRGPHRGRVESLDFGKRGSEGVVTKEVELVTGILVRENRLRRGGEGALARWKTGGGGGVTTTSRA